MKLRWMIAAARATAALLCTATLSASPAGIEAGSYRVVLQLPGGELPFGLDLTCAGGGWTGYLVNGRERLQLTDVAVRGTHVEIGMPGYENSLRADMSGDRLEGELTLVKPGGKDQHIPVHGNLHQDYRFFATAAGAPPGGKITDVSGRWSVVFTDDAGGTETAVGEFTQSQDIVSGTFLTDTGDHRFLAGQVHGDALYLSTFDGAHAFLYQARIAPDSGLSGDFWSGTAHHERWTAKRDATAALPDAYSLTTMHQQDGRFDFAFPDLAGSTVTSNDPKFLNKVIVVALAGSWCPNCHDEAAFLEPIYRDYRARGLEIVSLMFEHFGDFDRAVAAASRFKQHYGIEYTTLIAGISNKDDAGTKLPMLTRVYAFPTTVFIDRKGRVRKVHTGFSGPATGEHYTQFVDEFKRTLDQLLAES